MTLIKTWRPKTCWKSKFLGKKVWRNALALKSKKVYSGKSLLWHYYLQLSFVYKTVSQISFNLFCFEDKGLLSEFFRKRVNFRDIMNISPNILAKNQNFKKLRHGFVDEKAQIKTMLKFSCNWKTFVSFACEKKDLKTHF